VAGEIVSGVTPAPVRLTICGLLEALSLKFSVPLRPPNAIGVNVTLIVHALVSLGEGVSVAPVQVSALVVKSPGFVPPIKAEAMVRSAVPVFVTVTVWGALKAPTFSGPNVRLAGEGLTDGPGGNANFMMNALFPSDKAVLYAPEVVGNPGGAEPVT
jgi:hypothetical protein